MSREDAYCILNALPRIGWITLQKLLRAFSNDPVAALGAELGHLESLGFSPTVSENISQWPKHFNLESERRHLAQMGARFISFEHADYPPLLKTIYDPPIGLYLWGPVLPSVNAIAIVGSRYASVYGLQVAERFGSELAEHSWIVVSGFARGVDTASHRGALRVRGDTVAVLGCGIDRIYPPENADLYAQMRERGCILSEFPLGTRADRMTFPRRNRILSGLSQAVVVVESDIKGGSMLTATFAGEQNRQVFAVPGHIDSEMSRGCHQLIRNGATLVTSVEEILEDLKSAPPLPLQLELETKIQQLKGETPPKLEGEEAKVYHLLKEKGPLGSSEICTLCAMEPAEVQTILFSLELSRWINRRNDGRYEV